MRLLSDQGYATFYATFYDIIRLMINIKMCNTNQLFITIGIAASIATTIATTTKFMMHPMMLFGVFIYDMFSDRLYDTTITIKKDTLYDATPRLGLWLNL